MLIRVGYEFIFDVPAPSPMLLMLDLEPAREMTVRRPGGIQFQPYVPFEKFLDRSNNLCTRIVAPPGQLVIWDDLIVEDSGVPEPIPYGAQQIPVEELPYDVLVYLLGSRYCEVDRLSEIAWNLFGGIPGGYARVQAICDWVHNHVQFGYQFARDTKTAYDVYVEKAGVCRDFTHLALTLCRCMNIPARYATGYLGDIGVPPSPSPMDFSGWFEVYLDHRWYTFDARHNTPRIGRIVMARGRDAVDVAMTTSFGKTALNRFTVWTDEVPDWVLGEPQTNLAPGKYAPVS
jgi:transglutaminase-like putative cysteine protease